MKGTVLLINAFVKPYQIRQVRNIITAHGLAAEEDE